MSWIQAIFKKRKKKRKAPAKSRRGEPKLTAPREEKPKQGSTISPKEHAYERPVQPPRRPWVVVFKLMLLCFMLALGVLAYFSYDLPDVSQFSTLQKKPSIVVKAEDGTMLGTFGDVYGDYIPYKQLPKHLIDALLATEDRNFFYHFGVDPKGIMRAMWVNYRQGKVVQGGSTITQQLAKNIFLTSDRTMRRKIQEALLSLQLEWYFTKEEILTLYLNRVYLGAGNFGVDAAAKLYFGHSAREVNLGEAAMLTGLLKAPSRFSPTNNPELSEKRAWQVLINMVDAGMITQKQAEDAKSQLQVAENFQNQTVFAPYYFVDWVVDELPNYIGEVGEDIVVTTTLDPKLQEKAALIIEDQLAKEGEAKHITQAALLSMTPDGAIKAMIGGRNYRKSQYNRVTQAMRQPGSSFKPFVYLAGVQAGFMPDSLVEDKPVSVGRWTPKNYSGKYEGIMTMRDALAQSINTVAVQIAEVVGINRVVEVAHSLGINSTLDPVPSIALGSTEVNLLEMTTAYAHFANDGKAVSPFGIKEVRTAKAGNILYSRESSGLGQVLSHNQVAMMNDMMSAVVRYGTGGRASIGRAQAGKTGTTSDYKDAWFMGYTPELATGVWVGNDDNTPMKKITGGNMPAGIWKEYMTFALKDAPPSVLPTTFTSDENQLLPWLPGNQPNNNGAPRNLLDSPSDLSQLSTNNGAVAPASSDNTDVELSPSFWDKLMGSTPDVEHQYPSERRR